MIFWTMYWNASYAMWRKGTINYLKMMDEIYSP